jgi:hypothetical protein
VLVVREKLLVGLAGYAVVILALLQLRGHLGPRRETENTCAQADPGRRSRVSTRLPAPLRPRRSRACASQALMVYDIWQGCGQLAGLSEAPVAIGRAWPTTKAAHSRLPDAPPR